jgi:hypothetical protein
VTDAENNTFARGGWHGSSSCSLKKQTRVVFQMTDSIINHVYGFLGYVAV